MILIDCGSIAWPTRVTAALPGLRNLLLANKAQREGAAAVQIVSQGARAQPVSHLRNQ